MGTSLREVYEAFLARITADEWTLEEELSIVERDWRQLLKMAIFRFKYPRVSLEIEENSYDCDFPNFVEQLGNDEIQLLALFMKHEWLKRCIASWENVRQLYTDKDFSQANFLDKLNNLEQSVALEIHKAEGIYSRMVNKKPTPIFSKLAGKNK